ncbi:hypothetical protein NXS19_002052 [Fusarium pseudograminearum]|nr:hypothetical protein NXS19_002052 [Fusarium pseudograminearum]
MRSLRPSRPVFPGPEWTDKFSAPDSAIVALSLEYPDNFEDEVAHQGKVKYHPEAMCSGYGCTTRGVDSGRKSMLIVVHASQNVDK